MLIYEALFLPNRFQISSFTFVADEEGVVVRRTLEGGGDGVYRSSEEESENLRLVEGMGCFCLGLA